MRVWILIKKKRKGARAVCKDLHRKKRHLKQDFFQRLGVTFSSNQQVGSFNGYVELGPERRTKKSKKKETSRW
jgi:hypothetical protein